MLLRSRGAVVVASGADSRHNRRPPPPPPPLQAADLALRLAPHRIVLAPARSGDGCPRSSHRCICRDTVARAAGASVRVCAVLPPSFRPVSAHVPLIVPDACSRVGECTLPPLQPTLYQHHRHRAQLHRSTHACGPIWPGRCRNDACSRRRPCTPFRRLRRCAGCQCATCGRAGGPGAWPPRPPRRSGSARPDRTGRCRSTRTLTARRRRRRRDRPDAPRGR